MHIVAYDAAITPALNIPCVSTGMKKTDIIWKYGTRTVRVSGTAGTVPSPSQKDFLSVAQKK